MIQGCVSNYVCKNGEIVESNSVTLPESRMVIYDILRVFDGIPLFYESHANRFFRSFELAKIPVPFTIDFFVESIYAFISSEKMNEGNIRCAYYVNESPDFMVYEVEHIYPTAEVYKQGVFVDLLSAVRENPNIKQELNVRAFANKAIAEKGVYEVLFVDEQQNITEGSRSNVFFIKGNQIHTAPASDVLCGITRKKIFEITQKLSISIVERKISIHELSSFDAAFISSTPFKNLPISKIQNVTYSVSNEILRKLINAYDVDIKNYIQQQRQIRNSK